MQLSSKKTLAAVAVAIIVLLVAVALYVASLLHDTERLGRIIEKQIHHYTGQSISIGEVALDIRRGITVDLSRVTVSRGNDLLVEADRVIAVYSLWQLVSGDFSNPTLLLKRPTVFIRLDRWLTASGSQKAVLPTMDFENGTVKAVFRDREISLADINGRIGPNTLNLSAIVGSGAPLRLLFTRSDGSWSGAGSLSGFDLALTTPGIQGTADLDIQARGAGRNTELTLRIDARELALPGGGEPIGTFDGQVTIVADDHGIAIERLRLATPVISLAGAATLDQGLSAGGLENAQLSLTLSSNEFDYEKLVSRLPVDYFPDWLNELLGKQIRDGRMKIDTIAYDGPLSDFDRDGTFVKQLKIEARLNGLSFGAGHSAERIQNITAFAGTDAGDLIFTDIKGDAGSSRLDSVDLIFTDLMRPGNRVIVKADLDMPAADFVYAWRASMWPREVHQLLDPLTAITSGRIKGRAVFQEGVTERGSEVEGSLELSNCSFIWDNRNLRGISGRATADQFGAPLQLLLGGTVNDFPVRRLEITLADPFDHPTYQYWLETNQLTQMDTVKLGTDSIVIVAGSGETCEFEGSAHLAMNTFELMGTPYAALGEKITGAATVRGKICPAFELDLPDISISMPGGSLQLALRLRESTGRLRLGGRINAAEISGSRPDPKKPLAGGIDLALSWSDRKPLSGHFDFKDLVFFSGGERAVITGKTGLSNHAWSTNRLLVLRREASFSITGTMTTAPSRHFNGEVTIRGLSLDKTASDQRLPEGITATAALSFVDTTVYGILFDNGSAQVDLKNNRLRFSDIDFVGPFGSLAGTLILANGRAPWLDMDLDLRNKGVTNLLRTLYPDKELIEGYMRVNGDIDGSFRALNGKLAFTARDGHTMRASLITKILGTLNVYKIIKSRGLDLREKRFAFNHISATLTLKDSVVHSEDFYVDSDSIQLSAIGDYAINTNTVDALVGVQPLETIDRAVSVIPVIGWVLTGDDEKLFVVTMKLEGSAADPSIRMTPGDTISQPVKDTLLRILKLPEKIVNRPKALITEE